MTLRLRRGTDLERQSITFQEGELVYITDTKDLYAGDGTTVGGIKVSNIGSPSSLTQNLNLNGYSIQGSGTVSATSFIGDGSALTGIDIGVQSGQEYDINIRGSVRSFDSTVIVDPITNNIYGNFYGDGSNLVNVPGTITPSGDYTINILGYVKSFDDEVIIDPSIKTLYGDFIGSHQGSLRADDSTLLVDSVSASFFGTFVGDGSLLNNMSLSQLSDTDIQSPSEGEVLTYNGIRWANSPLFMPGTNYNVNITGSVSGNDSTLIFDADSNAIYINNLFFATALTLENTVANDVARLIVNGRENFSALKLQRTEPTIVDDSMIYGRVDFERHDSLGPSIRGAVGADNGGIFLTYNSAGIDSVTESTYVVFSNLSNFGVGTFTPTEKLDVRGNAVVTGIVTAASFNGSLVADDSTTIVDAINGSITASNYVQFGSLTTIQRDALVASNGMVIYNTTNNKFEGYQNGVWINLDDGLNAA
jgi:hypothetical protein